MTKHDLRGTDLRGLTRRQLLSRGLSAGALAVTGAGFIAAPNAAWALEVTAITPEQMATLLQMARDIYPHDKVADQFYAVAVKGYDTAENPVSVYDFHATVLHLLGIDHTKLTYYHNGTRRRQEWGCYRYERFSSSRAHCSRR